MKEILIACSALLFASCAAPWETGCGAENRSGKKTGRIVLPEVAPVTGGHCESSAIMNALRYEGYDVSECMIAGGGGALAFKYLKGTFPYIGARNEDMRERFFAASGIAWHKSIPKGENAGWDEIARLLADGIPVILRVDMRFLPYRWGGKYGPSYTSFGWHLITLFGIDYDKGIAYVSDTEFGSLQAVRLSDLHRARTSKTKNWPPRAEFYWAEKAPRGFQIDADRLVRASIGAVLENYRRGTDSSVLARDADRDALLEGLSGLSRYPEELVALGSGRNTYLLPSLLEYMAGNIEDFGTGGASFRMLYRDFIVWAARESSFGEVESLIPLLDDSIASWHALSAEFRQASKRIKGLSRDAQAAQFARFGELAKELYKDEKALYTGIEAVAREE